MVKRGPLGFPRPFGIIPLRNLRDSHFEEYAEQVKKYFGLKRTDFIEAKHGIASKFGWVGVTKVIMGRVKAIASPDKEAIIHEGVHAFFREKEIERGIPESEMTEFTTEEITAYIVSKTIVGKTFRICTEEVKRKVEEALKPYNYEKHKKLHPEFAREMRLEEALVADCVFSEDMKFVEKVKGKNPKAVYNAIASRQGYPKLKEV